MKKITKTIAAAVLAAAMMLPVLPIPAAAATTNEDGEIMIRVGLASSSRHNALGQLACAHLENADGYGEGYRFGYYDEDLNFVELARTDDAVTQLAMMKTQNLCYGYDSAQGRYTYSAAVKSNVKIGCYHVRIPGSWEYFEDAQLVAQEYDGGFVAWIEGAYQVRVGAWFTKDEALQAIENLGQGEVVGTSSAGISVAELGSDQILFQYDDRGETLLAVAPDVTESDDVQTWFRGYKYRGGFTYRRIDGGDLTVVNVLPLEDYVKGVAPYEMGPGWHVEALKTQATCARTYAMINLGKHEDLGFDVCNSHWCQVYNGCGTNRADYGPSQNRDRAVEESAGYVVTYNGKLAETYYSSSHGGASESVTNVWGSKLSKYPYLCGVLDPYEQAVDSRNAASPWQVTFSRGDLAKRLQGYGYGVGSKVDYLELTYSDLGNVIKLVVYWTNGQKNTFKPDDIRSYFGLNSIRFTVNDVTVQGSTDEEEEEIVVDEANTFNLNETDTISFGEDYTESVYVITGSGEVMEVKENPYAITGDGTKERFIEKKKVEEPKHDTPASMAGTVTVSGSSYVFSGRGWGHQIGMSQYGALAMAEQGFTFDQIIEFYFPGTRVLPYED